MRRVGIHLTVYLHLFLVDPKPSGPMVIFCKKMSGKITFLEVEPTEVIQLEMQNIKLRAKREFLQINNISSLLTGNWKIVTL